MKPSEKEDDKKIQSPISAGTLIFRTLGLALPLIALTIGIVYWIYLQQVKSETQRIIEREQSGIDVIERVVKRDFRSAIQDLIQLAESEESILAVSKKVSRSKGNINEKLLSLVSLRRIYRDARIIDFSGMELARVNYFSGKLITTPSENLQNKSHRYYFKETLRLKKGEVYISPFDLNMDFGKIEHPHTPVIRLATPIFDSTGQTRGMVILNYMGTQILDELENAEKNKMGRFVLLNTDGYYLKGFKPSQAWGFQLKDRAQQKFQHQYPDTWAAIQNLQDGKIINPNGIFLFHTIYPKEDAQFHLKGIGGVNTYKIADPGEKSWIIISFIPAGLVKNEIRKTFRTLSLYLIWLSIGIGVILLAGSMLLVIFRAKHLHSLSVAQQMARFPQFNPGPTIRIDNAGRLSMANLAFHDIFSGNPTGSLWSKIRSRYLSDTPQKEPDTPLGSQEQWCIGNQVFLFRYKKDPDTANIYGYGVDITELRQAQNALTKSEKLYRKLTEVSPVGIFRTDTNGNCTYVNARWCKITGLTPDEAMGEGWISSLHPDDKEAVFQEWNRSVNSGESFYLEYRFKYNQKITWVLGQSTQEMDNLGKVSGYIGTITDINNQKKMEQQLRNDETRYHSVLELAADAIITIDERGRIQEFNLTAQNYFGYELHEVIGQNVFMLAPEPYGSNHDKYLHRYLETGINKIIGHPREVVAQRKDGSIFPMDLSITEVKLEGKRLFTGIIRDITQRKEVQRHLQEAKQFANSTIDALSANLAIINDKGDIISVNQSWRNFAEANQGGHLNVFEGANYFSIINNKSDPYNLDANRFVNGVESVLKGESEFFQMKYPCHSPHEKRWFISRVTRFIQNGERFAVIAHENITEGKIAEEALKQFKATLDRTNDAVFIFDPDTLQFSYVNQGAIRQLGYALEEFMKIGPIDIKPDITETDFRKMTLPLIQGEKKSLSFETDHLHKTGHRIPVDISLQYIQEDGDLPRFVAIVRDITQQRRINRELEKARDSAEHAAAAKSEFLANMSHEIRTPMNAIIGMSYLALKTQLTSSQKDYLEKIELSAKSLLGIINDILDFSKVEAGKLTLEQIPFNLSDVLNDIVTLSAGTISDKGLELIIILDDKIPPMLTGDPVRIGQVFNNLLSNALKFTDQGDVEIAIRLKEQSGKTLVLECEVADTGIGMNPDETSKLFQKFSQADMATTRKYGGTGLGLAICKQLVQLMGGKIRVESIPGKGSRFIFTLVLGYPEDKTKTHPSHMLPLNLRNLKVLLLDANKKNLDNLKKSLQALTFKVVACEKCEQGLGFVKQAVRKKVPFELIIIDYRNCAGKTGLSGDQFLLSFSQSGVPIIVMVSINDIIQAEKQIKDFPMTSILTKPVTPSGLFNTIIDAFGYSEFKTGRTKGDYPGLPPLLELIQGASILLVEDNFLNQQVGEELLRQVKMNVTIANNGVEALALLKKQAFDLVLMDIQMPEMGGIEATERIRRLTTETRKIPIIAMTANAMAKDRQASLNAGMDDYISKPVDPDKLYACLLKWINPDLMKAKGVQVPGYENDPGQSTASALQKKLPDIDVTAGLKRVGGNQTLYENLLTDFAKEYHGAIDHIKNLLAKKDKMTAYRVAHTVNGLSATIGAVTLHRFTEKIETQIKQEKTIDALLSANSSSALDNVVSQINNAFFQKTDTSVQKEASAQNIKNISKKILPRLMELKSLVSVNDMSAEEVFNTFSKELNLILPVDADQISNALSSLEFKAAFVCLDQTIEKVKKIESKIGEN